MGRATIPSKQKNIAFHDEVTTLCMDKKKVVYMTDQSAYLVLIFVCFSFYFIRPCLSKPVSSSHYACGHSMWIWKSRLAQSSLQRESMTRFWSSRSPTLRSLSTMPTSWKRTSSLRTVIRCTSVASISLDTLLHSSSGTPIC